jgi:hypothetical protein
MTAELPFIIAQLRHAYMQLAAGTVRDQKQFAEGLLAPEIRRLESIMEREAAFRRMAAEAQRLNLP